MKIISNKNKLIKIIKSEKNLGFIPTMGSIHKGHISLIKRSINECEKTIVSIFVNKPQFNSILDYKKYPKTLKKDLTILRKAKVDYIYLPTNKQIYPFGPNKKIKINLFEKKLCGKNRPGHFKAVVDVIDRFIKIIKPKKIYFGEKDFQQFAIVEEYIKKNKIKIKVIGCKTIRENNGIPYSSRNSLLSKKQKNKASIIYNFILKKKNNLIKKKLSLQRLEKKILDVGVDKIDYIKILDTNKLIKPYKKKVKYKIFIAYNLGSTRLIDNI